MGNRHPHFATCQHRVKSRQIICGQNRVRICIEPGLGAVHRLRKKNTAIKSGGFNTGGFQTLSGLRQHLAN